MEIKNQTPQAGSVPSSAAPEIKKDIAAQAAAAPTPTSPQASELPKVEAPSIGAPSIGAPSIEAPGVEASSMAPHAEPVRPEPRLPPAPQPNFAPAGKAKAVPPPLPRDAAERPGVKPGMRSGPAAAARAAMGKVRDIPRSNRFALLAASVAIAACIGAGAGAFTIAGLVQLVPGHGVARDHSAELSALKESIAQIAADVGAVKAGLEHSGKVANAQFGRIVDRLERSERLQADPAAKLNKAMESLERLERRAATSPAAGPVAASAAASDITGSIPHRPAASEAQKPPVVEGWVIRRVYDGVALLQGRRGVIEVEAGDMLSGVGRVREIKREDGRWVVVTSKGLIVPGR